MNNDVTRTFRVLIADDESAGRIQIQTLLARWPKMAISAKVENGRQLLSILAQQKFDLLFVDIDMPELSGIEAIVEAQRSGIEIPYIIFITAHASHVAKAFELGAVDYLMKPVSEVRLQAAMHRFTLFVRSTNDKEQSLQGKLAERYSLTAREIEICEKIKKGCLRENIEKELGVSSTTMKTHLSNIYEKTGLTRTDETGRSDKYARLLFLLFTC